ncbi:uncharacterized protein LOC135485084 isoform X2 [Lineus longissimus]|uniref:uncharacterized protein LOC135485084 isoform X2 n=1 Tax=Lineus longissimus TaxID=88925 RepID=UPI002B4D16BF
MWWIWYVIYLFAILSGLFLAEMSIDRLIAIRFPMSAVKFCTRFRAWKTIIFTTILITVLNANVFWTYAYSMDEELGTDTMRASVPEYPGVEALAVGFQLGFGTFIPFSVIIFSNMWIVITVHEANKEREVMETSQSQGKKKRNKDTKYLTRMLILVSIAYVALSMPYRLYDAILNLPALKKFYNMRDIYWILRYGVEYCTINEVWYLNFGINFYLYCIGGGRKYRKDVKTVLREVFEMCGCVKPVPTATIMSLQTRTSAIKST